VGAGHAHALYVPRDSLLHRLPAQCKIAATVLFVLVVVSTPTRAFWAFGAYAAILLAVVLTARLSPLLVGRRMVVELPFVVFALLLPLVTGGERVDVLGLSLSESGLLGAFNLLAKATLGVVASITLASTTTIRDLLHGLERLHLPRQLVLIASFMVRYADVLAAEMARMKVARESRGFTATGLRSWPVLSKSLGALFLRSYERGERVHLAMRSRGFNGTMPVLRRRATRPSQWATAFVLPAAAGVVALTAALA
jgi:cobalt/nickel transport system permease protein